MPQLMACAGICAGYFTCYASVHIESSLSWRAPYIVQAGLGAVLVTSRFILPDSPRWLLFHGQRDKAIQMLKRLDFSTVEAEKDLLGPAAEQQMLARPGPVEGLVMIFRKQYRKRTVLALFTLGMVQLSGIDGVLYCKLVTLVRFPEHLLIAKSDAPTLFAQAGLPPTTASFLASGLSAILMLAISIPALLLVDRVSRRTNILVGGALLTTCMLIIGSLYASNSVHATGPARWVVIILVFVFGLTYCATWGVVGKIYASEIQPSVTRSSASCVAQGLNFFTNWIVAITTPVFLANSSFGAYFLFGFLCLSTVLVLAVYMPETRGQSLEAIRESFERPLGSSSRVTSRLRRWVNLQSRASSVSSGSSERIQQQGHGFGEGSQSVEMSGGVVQADVANASVLETGARSLRFEAS